MATQCSANRLHHVQELADRWSGPISVAVFIPGKEAGFALDAIAGLRKCWPETVATRTSFHLAFPSNVEADVSGRNSLVYAQFAKDVELKIMLKCAHTTVNCVSPDLLQRSTPTNRKLW